MTALRSGIIMMRPLFTQRKMGKWKPQLIHPSAVEAVVTQLRLGSTVMSSKSQKTKSVMTMMTTTRPTLARSIPCWLDRVASGNTGKTSSCFFSSASAAAADKNTIPFLLADIGEGIKEVEILQWFVQEGDTVNQFDKVCEVQSDKATVEITSRFDGVVKKLNAEAGSMVQVGSPLLYLHSSTEESGDLLEEQQPGPDEGAETSEKSVGSTSTAPERLSIPTVASHFRLQSDDDQTGLGRKGDGKFFASPAVRKLGLEYGIDLSTLHGSGPNGRLLKNDVKTYLKEQGLWRKEEEEATTSSYEAGKEINNTAPLRQSAAAGAAEKQSAVDEDEIVSLKGYHRMMFSTMTAALQIPHMGFGDDIDVSKLMEFRKELKAMAASKPNESSDAVAVPSLLAWIIKACSLALTKYPHVNAASIVPEESHSSASAESESNAYQLRVIKRHHIGVATDTPRGLVVPVIQNVQSKSVAEIQEALNHIKSKAASTESGFAMDELSNPSPTFTVSNIGSIGCGGTSISPILVPPQVAMGAFGSVQRLPRFVDENDEDCMEVMAAHVMHVSWAGDHRFLDGATLARFHATFKQFIQDPKYMLLNMR